ncbi:MAG: DUF2815 family protein [Ignavibacteria bacterium]|jgi:hypothetical protein|nr:DUF2815 family protein [Ignavibacteria bacterium]MCU7526435.1 DUF2815 family protein [Ignavibacteria bacterium]
MSQNQKPNPNVATKIVTDKVRLSYLHVWEPAAVDEGSEKKYSASIIIPKLVNGKKNPDVDKIVTAISAAIEQGKAKWGGKVPSNLKTPLRDGDKEREDDDAYAGSYFINASSTTKPGVVDANIQTIINQDELYSGCYGRVSINFYAFDKGVNKGIAAGLNNIQKLEDGDPLGGRSTPENDFAATASAGDLPDWMK